SDGATPMMDNTVSFGSTSHCGRRCAPREGLRRGTAPMLGFAVKTFAGVGSGQKSVLRAGETPHEVRHLRLHRRARRDAAEDLRGSARLAAGGRGCRLLRLSPHRAPRDAVIDDAVAERVSGRRRARNAAHPPRQLLYLLPLYHPLRLLEEL